MKNANNMAGGLRRQRGGTLVEGALTLMVFLSFIFAVVEFGRIYNMYQVLTNASREAARFGVAPCSVMASSCSYGAGVLPTNTDVQNKANSFLLTANIRVPNINNYILVNQQYQYPGTSTPCASPKTASDPINGVNLYYTCVYVKAPYKFLFFPFGTINLHSQSVMRNETN